MTSEEAAWVREHVWTNAQRAIEAAYPHGYYGMCSCQGGICGACDGTSDKGRPRHDRCLSRQHGHPVVSPETYLTNKKCMVIGPPLWRASGPPCRYICPCPCAKTGPAESAPERRRPAAAKTAAKPVRAVREVPLPPVVLDGQDGLFDLAVRA